MLRTVKSLIHKVGRAYVRKLTTDEFEQQRFKRHNERPLEFGFVFEQLAYLRPRTVLDIGTGVTALPHMMHNCGCIVTAIDNVKDYWTGEMVNRHWLVKDDDILSPETIQQFDLVTCISVIEHIVDHLKAFRNMAALVKPGGHLIVTTPYSENNYCPNVYKLEDAAYGRDLPYQCRSTSRAELDQWVGESKLEIVRQDFYQLWTGTVWTQGEFLQQPRRVSKDEPHQLSLMLFKRPVI